MACFCRNGASRGTLPTSRRSEEGRGGEKGRTWGGAGFLKKKKKNDAEGLICGQMVRGGGEAAAGWVGAGMMSRGAQDSGGGGRGCASWAVGACSSGGSAGER